MNLEKDHIRNIQLDDGKFQAQLFGDLDTNLKEIESLTGANITLRNDEIIINSDDEEKSNVAFKLLNALIELITKGEVVDKQSINYALNLIRDDENITLSNLSEDIICVTNRGKFIKPKTIGQKKYVDAVKQNDIVFSIGPAGTGKTYLAVAMAVRAFKNKEVNRIILTRPAVEAGESLGFLPGDLQMKIDPYLRPLYDALYDILGNETYFKYKERGLIEVAPLAYMRGRTLDDAFIILDEAQNTTQAQMKMFLTRIGFSSKTIVTGDVTQIDLPKGKASGLKQAAEILNEIPGIGFTTLTGRDVVRHRLVQKIIKAYDKYEKNIEYKKSR
jgi:phosphate starvation-inducible PhoH-like protein